MDLRLELFFNHAWHEAARLAIGSPAAGRVGEAKVDYEMAYFAEVGAIALADDKPLRDARALSVALPVDLADRTYPTWPPFLLDLLPQGHQRDRIADHLKLDPNAPGSDLPLLMHGAGSPVGNLRIREAREQELKRLNAAARVGVTMADILTRTDKFVEVADRFAMLASGSSGLQGNSPKIAMTMAADGLWYPDSAVEDKDARKHVIVKFARGDTAADIEILKAEAPYLAIADEFGLDVAGTAEYGDGVFVVPRFDRVAKDDHVIRYGQESFVSALDVAEFGHTDSHENYLKMLRRFSSDPLADVIEYVLRDLLNLAMGNTDNHGRNTALRKDAKDGIRLAPLFDFAPMRLSPAIVARSTKWECMREQGRDYDPDWKIVCEAAAGGELDPKAIMAALADKADFLRNLRDIGKRHRLSDDVLKRAFAHTEKMANAVTMLGQG